MVVILILFSGCLESKHQCGGDYGGISVTFRYQNLEYNMTQIPKQLNDSFNNSAIQIYDYQEQRRGWTFTIWHNGSSKKEHLIFRGQFGKNYEVESQNSMQFALTYENLSSSIAVIQGKEDETAKKAFDEDVDLIKPSINAFYERLSTKFGKTATVEYHYYIVNRWCE